MKIRPVHYFLALPLLCLILLLINNGNEAFIVWGLLYIALLPIYALVSLVLIAIEKYRKDGLHLLLGTGILALLGFTICSSGMF